MDGYERIAAVAEVCEGEISEHWVSGVNLCLTRSNGTVYAFGALCTHQECPLSAAFVDGVELECSCHGAIFDLATGMVTLPPAIEPLPVYPVRELNGEIWVAVDAPDLLPDGDYA